MGDSSWELAFNSASFYPPTTIYYLPTSNFPLCKFQFGGNGV